MLRKAILVLAVLAAVLWPHAALADGERLRAALTTVALSYPTPDRGEPPEARAERLDRVSDAVVAAAERATCSGVWETVEQRDAWIDGEVVRLECRTLWSGDAVELAALAWSVGYLESGYAEWVHAGRCRFRIGECDAGRARSPWQLQRTSYTREAWPELEGVGEWSTFQGAWAAVRVLSATKARCKSLEGTIAGYATGGNCSYPRAAARARFVLRVEARLRDALRAGTPDAAGT